MQPIMTDRSKLHIIISRYLLLINKVSVESEIILLAKENANHALETARMEMERRENVYKENAREPLQNKTSSTGLSNSSDLPSQGR